ncbi:MAG: cupin domain-containing protein [Chthoniobacter sp.]|nr:cupin domain-containing protein [Chthoniobacter sp.]
METDPIDEAINLVLANRSQHHGPERRAMAPATPKAGPVELLREPYPDDPTREIVLLRATFSPGDSTPPHQHPGLLVGYVLTGELEFQLEGQPLQRLIAGDRFYEPPESEHVVSRNPGETTTQVLAFIVRERGAPVMIPLKSLSGEGLLAGR